MAGSESGLLHRPPNPRAWQARSTARAAALLLARDLKLIPTDDYAQATERVVEIKRMLTGLIQKLNADLADG